MTDSEILKAAIAYSQCGNWREVSESLGSITKDAVRIAVTRAGNDNPIIFSALVAGRVLSEQRYRRHRSKPENFIPKYHVRSDLAFKRDREIYKRRTSQPSPVTLGQKLMGEPLPGRSALEKFEADGRSHISKGKPRVTIGSITVRDISINNNHSQ